MSQSKKKLTQVAICGRRNAGKSTLFNILLGKNRAITDEYAGLTRDLLEAEIIREPYHFILSDTPGLDVENPDELEAMAIEKAIKHLENVDSIILLFEAGILDIYDHKLIEMVRKIGKPVLYTVNKVDDPGLSNEILLSYYNAGLVNVVPISAKGRWNINLFLEKLSQISPDINRPQFFANTEENTEREEQKRKTTISDSEKTDFSIAIVGKPNAGKSSLLNRIVRKEVSLVSNIPGTTRDTIDTIFQYQGKTIRITDTAGLRKTSFFKKKNRQIDFYSISRAKRAIRDSDIIIHLIDGIEGMSDFDKKISSFIKESGRACIVAINKWDAVPDKNEKTMKEYLDKLSFHMPHIQNYPVVFCSAQSGQRISELLNNSIEIHERMNFKLSTSQLNKIVSDLNARLKGSATRTRVWYATQADGFPPAFIFFVNDKNSFRKDYIRFFENRLRELYNLSGIPISFIIKEKND